MMLQWGRRNYPAETRRPRSRYHPASGFNGAAGITRRKLLRPVVQIDVRLHASMGPPELPGGNESAARSGPWLAWCFNGAAGITRRKHAERSERVAWLTRLQWGRRNYPAETSGRRATTPPSTCFNGAAGITRRKLLLNLTGPVRCAKASMGPPELPGGNEPPLQVIARALELQWGRRNYPAETRYADPVCLRATAASMGPPELPGGNLQFSRATPVPTIALQWGRRNYPAETNVHKVPGNQHTVASMGPPELPGGNWSCAGTGLLSGRSASMGPPELPGGNAAIGCAGPAVALLQWGRRNYPAETAVRPGESSPQPGASMGPPELPGGNSRPRKIRHARNERLQWGRRNYPAETSRTVVVNAIILVLQWGRRNYPAETRQRRNARPAYGGRLQWGRRNYPAETPPVATLNAAKAAGASMGPPELPGGNADRAPTTAASRMRFNGAAGITRRKPQRQADLQARRDVASMGPPELPGGNGGDAHTKSKLLAELQWGRRNYPAETSVAETGLHHRLSCFNGAAGITRRKHPVPHAYIAGARPASMGPPELPGGNGRRIGRLRVRFGRLQWGRRNYPAETTITISPSSSRSSCFNGAAGITRRKQEEDCRAENPARNASMGPPELPGGNRPARPCRAKPCRALQWGRRNYPAETRKPPRRETLR